MSFDLQAYQLRAAPRELRFHGLKSSEMWISSVSARSTYAWGLGCGCQVLIDDLAIAWVVALDKRERRRSGTVGR